MLKRTPMPRSKTWSTAGARNLRAAPKKDEPTPAEKAHMARVRRLRCNALGQPGHARCSGPMVAHHAGRHGTGQKSSHYDTVALCDTAHRELHDMPGNGWTSAAELDGEQVRELEDKWIANTHRVLGVDSNGPLARPTAAETVPF